VKLTDYSVVMTEFAKIFMGMKWGTLQMLREAHADGRNVLCQVQGEEDGSR
jgi:hypothetical protein